ncbi:N-6 DNA methylase [Curtobacterium flaccumfaciens pv. betae]|uniref:HsdM family class I SAM-dependent methyltransferase n=1 Tax=Curtobacterium flaccumfaciens TaxID=2035 RepID=UPI002659FA35|nr:N-6 DNA methylase [Curtobacterium flaccumfaciens]MCS5514584.1 N-6 DNA methylase [Curtobacterium flaccumfaciens pv. betae]
MDSTVPASTQSARKLRGAFFTPRAVAEHLADWAIETSEDTVLEPSAGEAAFMVAAVGRKIFLGAESPRVDGVELDSESARIARQLVLTAGGQASIIEGDFFDTPPSGKYTAVIGNPPFIRYQHFAGDSRERAREAARTQGVILSGLASSWAAFVVHSAAQLKPGGRLGMVLPAELMSAKYAAPIRQFLLERFRNVDLVTFATQIFPDAEADTVLLKASGWGMGPTRLARLQSSENAQGLKSVIDVGTWTPSDTSARWAPLQLRDSTLGSLSLLTKNGTLSPLKTIGSTTLGMVTGANKFFTLSPSDAKRAGIPPRDRIRISPPGSSHLRSLGLDIGKLTRLGALGGRTWLLYPSSDPAPGTLAYIEEGRKAGIDQAYKCQVRSPWWRVPLLKTADLFLTYMNSDGARLIANEASVGHLNSVHGVNLREDYRPIAKELLPIAALNSASLLSAEMVGRSYGGGILKLEPREADEWLVPSGQLLEMHADRLRDIQPAVLRMLRAKNLLGASALVDTVVLSDLSQEQLTAIRTDHQAFMTRRLKRGNSGRISKAKGLEAL